MPTEIIWKGEARPEFNELVWKEIEDLQADGLGHTDDLITHLIEVSGDLENGPLIEVEGHGGKLYAEYVAEPKWVTLAQS
jgi:hypothetical protein